MVNAACFRYVLNWPDALWTNSAACSTKVYPYCGLKNHETLSVHSHIHKRNWSFHGDWHEEPRYQQNWQTNEERRLPHPIRMRGPLNVYGCSKLSIHLIISYVSFSRHVGLVGVSRHG